MSKVLELRLSFDFGASNSPIIFSNSATSALVEVVADEEGGTDLLVTVTIMLAVKCQYLTESELVPYVLVGLDLGSSFLTSFFSLA